MDNKLIAQWEKIWDSDYGKSSIRFLKAKEKIEFLLEQGFYIKDGMRVLDGGCGDGTTLYLLKSKFDIEPFGIDICKKAFKKAVLQQEKLDIELKEGDVRSIPYPDNFFDVVLSFGVIEHFIDYEKSLEEFYRVLKPGGKLCLIQPHKFSLRHIKRFWLLLKNKWPFGMQINFSGRFLKKILLNYNFKNVEYFIMPYSPHGFINKLDDLLHKINKKWGYYLYIWGEK